MLIDKNLLNICAILLISDFVDGPWQVPLYTFKSFNCLSYIVSIDMLLCSIYNPYFWFLKIWDATASDPKLLVFLKSYRNTVPVPRHWCQKRKYLQVSNCSWYAFYLLNYECITMGLLVCVIWGRGKGDNSRWDVILYVYMWLLQGSGCDIHGGKTGRFLPKGDNWLGSLLMCQAVGWDVEHDWYLIILV